MKEVHVYGADWCEDTEATLQHLRQLRVPFRYIDIEADPQAAQWVKDQNRGKQKTPTVDVQGDILVEPTGPELEQLLRNKGFIA